MYASEIEFYQHKLKQINNPEDKEELIEELKENKYEKARHN